MKIEIEKYILNSDQYQFWIDERFKGQDKNKNEKDSIRRVTGYMKTLPELAKSFCKEQYMGADADSLRDVIEQIMAAENNMIRVLDAYFEQHNK